MISTSLGECAASNPDMSACKLSLVSCLLTRYLISAGDPYTNYVLSGLVELPSYICSPLLLAAFGRKPVVSGFHLLSALAFFIITFVHHPTASLIIWLIGKFAISTGEQSNRPCQHKNRALQYSQVSLCTRQKYFQQ